MTLTRVLEIPLPSQPCNSRPASTQPVPLKQAEILLITQLAASPRADVRGSRIMSRKHHKIKEKNTQSNLASDKAVEIFFCALYSSLGKIWRCRPFYLHLVCSREHQGEKIQHYQIKLQLMQVQH